MNPSDAENPLVTLIVVSYQQEPFIRDAIAGALAQTYQPLQIVFADDGSRDGTYEILAREAGSYRGPHQITLLKAEGNRGLPANLARAWRNARGAFVVVQGGDDVSLPERVERLVHHWRTPTTVDLVVSDVEVIDRHGGTLRRGWHSPVAHPRDYRAAIDDECCYTIGCAVGYSRRMFEDFGEIHPDVAQEDWVLPFRALLGRGVRTTPEILVKYRTHGGNLWHGQQRSGAVIRTEAERTARNRLGIFSDWRRAWEIADPRDDHYRRRLEALIDRMEDDLECFRTTRVGSLRIVWKALRRGSRFRHLLGLIRRHTLRVGSYGRTRLHFG